MESSSEMEVGTRETRITLVSISPVCQSCLPRCHTLLVRRRVFWLGSVAIFRVVSDGCFLQTAGRVTITRAAGVARPRRSEKGEAVLSFLLAHHHPHHIKACSTGQSPWRQLRLVWRSRRRRRRPTRPHEILSSG